jgi:hypothetical protein
MNKTKSIYGGMISSLLLSTCVSVQAQLDYDATYSINAINAHPESAAGLLLPGAQLTFAGSSINGTDSAGIILGSDPEVYSDATGIGAGGQTAEAGANAEFTYFFALTGTTSYVPILVSASGSVTQSGNPNFNFSSANFAVEDYVGPHSGTKYFSQNLSSSGTTTFSVDQDVEIPGGDVIEVIMGAGTTVGVPGGASASVDPQISIDPAYLAANPGVSLEFSPYITPEPSSLGLILGGLAAVVGVRRRKHF